MSGAANAKPGAPILKVVILAFLVGAMLLLHRYGAATEGFDPTGLLAFGFVVLASYTIGQLAAVIRLPQLIGYIITGFILGPSMAQILPAAWRIAPFDKGILNHEVQAQLSLLDALAVALIALAAGGELKVDSLRRGFRWIAGMMGGHALFVFTAVFAFGWAISGHIPGFQLDALAKLDPAAALAMAGLLATFGICTSPAVTIAVINSTGARGPLTRLILSAVVLIDVPVAIAFSIAGMIAGSVLGAPAEGSIASHLVTHVVGSMVIGGVVGALMSVYLRYVGAELLLFIIGVAYTGTFIAKGLHLSPLLLFVAAGFVCGNFSRKGDTLIANIEQLSMPVYVVFFTMAGAHIDLGVFLQAAPFAFPLAAIRAVASIAGVKLGARLSGADPLARKYAWTGFISQAGVALSLAALIGTRYGDPGIALSTMMLSCIAINEVFGAIIFKTGLGLAGEIPDRASGEEMTPAATTTIPPLVPLAQGRLPTWPPVPPLSSEHVWGPAQRATASPELDAAISALETDLKELAASLERSLFDRYRTDAERYARELRREYLRFHRSGTAAQLASEWRRIALERAVIERDADDGAAFEELLEKLDALKDRQPQRIIAPYDARSYASQPGDSLSTTTRRLMLRARRSIRALFGLGPPQRTIAFRDLAQYHLGGRAPAKLEAAAATLVEGELHLGQRTARTFASIVEGRSREGPTEVLRLVENELGRTRREIELIAASAAHRVALAFGGALAAIKDEALVMSTFELRDRSRRYSLVFRERTRALAVLTDGLRAARANVASGWALVALGLELERIEIEVAHVIEEHGRELERLVAERGRAQLEKVREELDHTLRIVEAELDGGTRRPAPDLAASLRGAADRLAQTAGEAARSSGELVAQLAEEKTIAPILETLLAAASSLADRYEVPTSPLQSSTERLMPPVPLVEVPFRDIVVAYIETSIAKRLFELTRKLSEKIQPTAVALSEIERLVAFNTELAAAELDVFGSADEVSEATRAVVREMVLGPLGRSRARLAQLAESAASWSADVEEGIRAAVSNELATLRKLVLGGKAAKLELRAIREVAAGKKLLAGAGDVRGLLRAVAAKIAAAAKAALGEERFQALRTFWGAPEAKPQLFEVRDALRPPASFDKLPLVYRRLFSEHALHAGDLLTGRAAELSRAHAALTMPGAGGVRAVAIIGRAGVGKSAVIDAIVRGLGVQDARRIVLDRAVGVGEVASWFSGEERAGVAVLEGLEHLFAMRPGGFAPLQRFVAGVVADRGRTAWIVGATTAVWRHAARIAALEAAFPEVIELEPSNVEALSAALLARHAMSGYQLRFETGDTLGPRIARPFSRRPNDAEWREQEWFRTLHALTEGLIRDGLRSWLASVRRVDEQTGVVVMGPIPRPPLAMLRALPDDMLLALAQVERQGWIDAAVYASLFRCDGVRAEAELSRLVHLGLLQPHGRAGERCELPAHLAGPIHRVLAARPHLPRANIAPNIAAVLQGSLRIGGVVFAAWLLMLFAPAALAPALPWVMFAAVAAAIGWSARDLLPDLIAGAVLRFEGRIRPGDWIESPDASGEVETMGLRSTALAGASGKSISVPNRKLLESPVASDRARWPGVELTLHVPEGCDGETAREAIREAVLLSPELAPEGEVEILRAPSPAAAFIVRARVLQGRFRDVFASALRSRVEEALDFDNRTERR